MHAPDVLPQTTARPRTGGDILARAILAGFVASLTMLLLFLVAYNLARLLSAAPIPTWPALERDSIIRPISWVTRGGQGDLAAGGANSLPDVLETPRLWLINLTQNRFIDTSLADVYFATGIYFAGGLIWAVIYAFVEPRLPGSPWQRGVIFAMLPALVSLVVVLPLLGGGMLGLGLGAGPLPVIGNVLLHAVYGAVLGVIYGPFGDLDAGTLERPTATDAAAGQIFYEPTAALLLLGGLVVGTLAGLVVSVISGDRSGSTILGASSAGLVLWGALLGAVLGLFIGSFLGLEHRVAPDRDR